MKKPIKLLSKIEMEKLTTQRLLAYKNRLMKVPEEPNWDEETAQISKQNTDWILAYANLKQILNQREHVE